MPKFDDVELAVVPASDIAPASATDAAPASAATPGASAPRGRVPDLDAAAPAAAPASGARRSAPSANSTGYFDEIKRRVPLESYLEDIGVELTPAGNMLVACCPFHEEKTASFQVVDGKSGQSWQTWVCRGACDTGGTVIDAVMLKEGFTAANDAADWLNDRYELHIERDARWAEQRRVFNERVKKYTGEANEGRDAYTKGETKVAQEAHAYLQGRGFTDSTIDNFRLGVAHRRIQIPLIDTGNCVVATDGRAMFDSGTCRACGEQVTAREMFDLRGAFFGKKNKGETSPPWERCPKCGKPDSQAKVAWLAGQHPKYLFPKGFDKTEFLFNFHDARKQLSDHKNAGKLYGLFLAEGYMDAFAVWQAGQLGVCSYNGKILSLWQAKKICELAAKRDLPVILIPDFDATGRRYVRRNIEMLRAVDPGVEIQVLFSIDQFPNDKGGTCKDAADIQRYQGSDTLARLLLNERRPAEEWLIREIVDKPVELISTNRQIELVAEILASVRHRISLSHLIPYLAEHWHYDPASVAGWFGTAMPGQAAQHEHLFKTAQQAREEAVEWRQHEDLIRWGYDEIDEAVGGGFRRGWINLLIAKSGAGKSAIACQLVAHWAEMGYRVIFFSLEMQAAQLFERMVCQVLDVDSKEAIKLVKDNSPELDRVVELYRYLYIVDNVPTADREAVPMTPATIERLIREANMTKFRDRPTDIVVIDHLGIVACPEDAPKNVQNDEIQAEGYKVQKMFEVTKTCNVYTLVLQQVSKAIKPGMPFEAGDGRGGSKQLDFADQVVCVWRPEHEAGIEEGERLARKGLIVVALMKNRYGIDYLKLNMTFDPQTLKILPDWQAMMPIDDLGEGVHVAANYEAPAVAASPETAALGAADGQPALPAGTSELDDFLGGGALDGEGILTL